MKTFPDDSAQDLTNVNIDLAEHARRAGGFPSLFRSGRVIYYNPFERLHLGMYGMNGTNLYITSQWGRPFLYIRSMQMTGQNQSEELRDTVAPILSGNIGFELEARPDGAPFGWWYFDIKYYYDHFVKIFRAYFNEIQLATLSLYRDTVTRYVLDQSLIDNTANLHSDVIKLVVNPTTGAYVRMFYNDRFYNLAGMETTPTDLVFPQTPRLEVGICRGSADPTMTLACANWIVTVDE